MWTITITWQNICFLLDEDLKTKSRKQTDGPLESETLKFNLWNTFILSSGILCDINNSVLHLCTLLFKSTSQTSWQFDLELYFSNESRRLNFLNVTMGRKSYDASGYPSTVIIVFGILGNILVILSIQRQKKNVLKNNYYFLVLHLAICDLAVLIIYLFNAVEDYWLKEPLSGHLSMIRCHVIAIAGSFQLAGVGIMLIISLLRYRATVHPLKPAVSQPKLKVVCALVYIVGLIVACGTRLPICFIKSTIVFLPYAKFYYALGIFFAYFVPKIFMAVVYYKIAQALIKQIDT